MTSVAKTSSNAVPLNSSSSKPSHLPSAGIAAGVIVGSTVNFLREASVAQKSSYICTTFKDSSLISTLNGLKQLEIKSFALASPLILLVGAIGYRLYHRDTIEKDGTVQLRSVSDQLSLEIKRLPVKTLAASVVCVTGGVLLNHPLNKMLNQAGFTTDEKRFDVSGHVIMSLASNLGMVAVLDYALRSGQKNLARAAAGIAAVSTAIFLVNTTACHHSVPEVAMGAVVGVSLGAVAHVAVGGVAALAVGLKRLF